MTTGLCLWEGEGYYREKQVPQSFDLRCSLTSLLQSQACSCQRDLGQQ